MATALAANDRAKYYMSLLQQCRQHAIHPEHACLDLRDERITSGESDTSFDEIVAASRLDDDGSIVVPRLAHIEDRLLHSIGEMIAPVSGADTELGRPRESYRAATAGAARQTVAPWRYHDRCRLRRRGDPGGS